MTHRTPLIALLVLGALGLGLTACSDDDPVAPDDSFALTITVLDLDGQPLADSPVIVMPLLPAGVLQDDKQAAMPAAVQIPFQNAEPCLVDVVIRDVAGAAVRHLITDHQAPAGEHRIFWNGLDDEGATRYTGWYGVEISCCDAGTDEILFTDSSSMLMVHVDYDQTEFHTGPDGTLTITDRRVVPAFFDVPEMRFTDEDGELTGLYTFTRWTQVRAVGQRVDFEAVDGPQSFTLQRAPLPAGAPASAIVTDPPRDAPTVDPEFGLGDPMPNPFN